MTTIAKVAQYAGVSPTTVSHVINHRDRVSAHLRERVEKAIAELGYAPNAQAKSLRTGRTNIIALLIPDISNSFYTELVRAAQAALNESGRDVMVFNADVPGGDPQAHSREYMSQIRTRGIDGLIVGDFALHGMYDAVAEVRVPTVFVGHLPDPVVDNVKVDDFGCSYRMGQHLAARGHRRVAHVTGPSDFPAAMIRADGFRQGLIDGGVAPEGLVTFEGTYLSPSGAAGIDWLVEAHRDHMPSAVFFSNFLMATGGLAAIFDHHLRVPDDLAVCLFGNHPPVHYVRPKLTHVGVPPAELALRACAMLLDRLEGRHDGAPRTEVLEGAFQVNDSA
jgi:DNA-binding LacI/PurR family transcriptional regulator